MKNNNSNYGFTIKNVKDRQRRSSRNFTPKRNLSQGPNRPQTKVGNFTKTSMYGSKTFLRNSTV